MCGAPRSPVLYKYCTTRSSLRLASCLPLFNQEITRMSQPGPSALNVETPAMRGDAMQYSQGGETPSVHASINPSIHPVDSRFEVAEEVLTPLQSSDLPIGRTVRPGWGTLGSLTAVRTNLFALELTRDTLYEYGVTISPHPRS